MIVLEVSEVSKTYQQESRSPWSNGKRFCAVNRVSLTIKEQECVGLVGESGCGKSTLSRLILALDQPDSGEIFFMSKKWNKMSQKQRFPYRKYMQAVFQNSLSSMNPRLKAGDIVVEPLLNYVKMDRKEAQAHACMLLDKVGLDSASIDKYPHQFSGGQQQRLAIARAISVNPKLIVLDEAISNLDVITQSAILSLLNELKTSSGISYLFITHDIKAACFFCDRLLVMQEGSIVDEADAKKIEQFSHPAALELLNSMLVMHPEDRV